MQLIALIVNTNLQKQMLQNYSRTVKRIVITWLNSNKTKVFIATQYADKYVR